MTPYSEPFVEPSRLMSAGATIDPSPLVSVLKLVSVSSQPPLADVNDVGGLLGAPSVSLPRVKEVCCSSPTVCKLG